MMFRDAVSIESKHKQSLLFGHGSLCAKKAAVRPGYRYAAVRVIPKPSITVGRGVKRGAEERSGNMDEGLRRPEKRTVLAEGRLCTAG